MLKRNITNLFLNQIFSYVIPLLLLPYLSYVLTVEYLGLYVLALSFINFGSVIINYGFEISIAKKIAEGKKSKLRIGKYLFQITVIKLILSTLTIFSILIINYSTDYFDFKEITIICFSLIASSFNLNWLFQGLEKIYIFSRITILTRIVSIGLIFLFVKGNNDFILLLFFNSLQAFLSLFIAYLISYRWGYYPIISSRKSIFFTAKESTEYFISRLGVSLYSTSCSFFLGIFGGSLQQVAIYGVAEQIYRAGVYALSAISTPLIPFMARTKNYSVFFKLTLLSSIITFIGAAVGILYGDHIILLVFGDEYIASKDILNIFMITIPISTLGMFFGYPALIPLKKTKIANFSVIYAGILQLISIATLVFLNIKLTAMLVVSIYLMCESFVLFLRLITFISAYKHNERCAS